MEKIYDALRTRPRREADEVLQRIRGGADANSILRYISFGDVHLQTVLVPETRFRFEFPYLTVMPAYLFQPDNPYLDSQIYNFTLRANPSPRQLSTTAGSLVPSSAPRPHAESSLEPYLKPFQAAVMSQPGLDEVAPSKWTSVSSDDDLMRKLLFDYFQYEYDWFTFFHKDYFLEDMAKGRPRFCTELLANSVLCLGCVRTPKSLLGIG